MERTLLWVLVVVVLAFAQPARAGEIALLVNGHAKHLEKSPKDKNELNYGLGLQYDFDPHGNWVWFAFGSGFEDSRNDPSWNAGGGARKRFMLYPRAELFVDLGLAGMLMVRESYNDGRPFLAALPVASVGVPAVALNIAYVPEVDTRIIPLVFFQFKYRLK